MPKTKKTSVSHPSPQSAHKAFVAAKLVTIKLTEEELKENIIDYIQRRRAFVIGTKDTPAQSESDIDVNSWLDDEHVEHIIRHLVAIRPPLAKTVGVFPIFNIDEIERYAKALIEKKIIADAQFAYLTYENTPLPEKSSIQGQALAERNKEEQRRIKIETVRSLLASDILKENGFDKATLFKCFLESVSACPISLLGNFKYDTLHFDDCEQWIIPFRKDSNHFTVAVLHLTNIDEKRINIQYYDSLGREIPDAYFYPLICFVHDYKGFSYEYKCLSQFDQREKVNCGIFASFKAIDIANANAKLDEESLLAGIEVNYKNAMIFFRQRLAETLQDRGQKINISPRLKQNIEENDEQNKQTLESTTINSVRQSEDTVILIKKENKIIEMRIAEKEKTYLFAFNKWFKKLNWKQSLAVCSLVGCALFLGLSPLMALINLLPASPLLGIIGGATIFYMGFELIKLSTEYFNPSDIDSVSINKSVLEPKGIANIKPDNASESSFDFFVKVFTPSINLQSNKLTTSLNKRVVIDNEEKIKGKNSMTLNA